MLHRGPLPSPEMLGEYERVHPGLAERIVALAEGEAKHRREMEAEALRGDTHYMRGGLLAERRGQYLAVAVAIVMGGIGAYLVLQGHDVAGGSVGVSGVGGIVTALIVGRSKDSTPVPTDKSVAAK